MVEATVEFTPCGRGPDSYACGGCDCGLETRQVRLLRAEVERLNAELATLREWAASESAHWDGRNADRYWQMQRVLHQLEAPKAS